jgi:NAD(P)-dependent dehydrogenase (short-subunit alcohol dehydrogenase family)
LGVVKVTQAVMPHLRRKRSGTVVFIGSVGGIAGDPGAAAVSETVKVRFSNLSYQYCASKAALYGWYDCFRKETIHLNVRSVLFELGFFRTKMFHPDNIKNRPNVIEDYDEVRNAVSQFIHDINGTQSGDPRKAVEIMLDVVKGEGTAKGRQMPHRLPLGPDCVARMRQTCAESLAICDEWEDLICNTNFT